MVNYEEETEVVETPEVEVEDADTEVEESEESIDYKAEFEKTKAELEKAQRAILKNKDKTKSEPKKESAEDVTIARLEARGILNADDQAYILKYAKVEGVHYLEALEDDFVKDKLDRNKRERLSASAAPRGNNRAPGDTNEVSAAVKRYQKDGTLPDNPALVSKVLKAIKNN